MCRIVSSSCPYSSNNQLFITFMAVLIIIIMNSCLVVLANRALQHLPRGGGSDLLCPLSDPEVKSWRKGRGAPIISSATCQYISNQSNVVVCSPLTKLGEKDNTQVTTSHQPEDFTGFINQLLPHVSQSSGMEGKTNCHWKTFWGKL